MSNSSKLLMIITIIILNVLSVHSQELGVKSFSLSPNDLSASIHIRQDQTGNDCAMVKVQMGTPDATFTGNIVGKVNYHTSEYWIYMSEGSRHLQLSLGNQVLDVSFDDYGIDKLQAKSVYILIITGINEPTNDLGALDISCPYSDVNVCVDGKDVGQAPVIIDNLLPGNHIIMFSKEGFLKKEISAIVRGGEVVPVTVTLSQGTVLQLHQGESLSEKMSSIPAMVDSLMIIGSFSNEDWKALNDCLKTHRVRALNLSEVTGEKDIDCNFLTNRGLVSVVFPNHVENMSRDQDVFEGNDGGTYIESKTYKGRTLESITLPSHMKSIPEGLFAGFPKLSTIVIPESVEEIGWAAFFACDGLKTVQLPGNLKKIWTEAFHTCKSLRSIEIPNSVQEIGWATFKNCENLETVILPNNITELDGSVFANCKHLTSLEIPNSVTKIACFYGCTGLKSFVIPNSVTEIGNNAFKYCTGLTSLTIPNSVTSIGYSAFSGCTGLTSLTIPNSVTSIGGQAFEGCTSLESITLPTNIQSVPSDIFDNCPSLKEIKGLNAKSMNLIKEHWASDAFDRGWLYYKGGQSGFEVFPQDYSEAVRWWRKAAELGHAQAQCNLGVMYSSGQGVTEDKAEAVRWYRKAAEQGLAIAQSNLGIMYYRGEGVPQDKSEAVRWYRKAAEQGHADAQCDLGVMYDNGEGVTEDKAEAVRWYRKAAEQGYARAQFYLGWMYDNGDGVAQDRSEAVKWWRKAAEQGQADAQKTLRSIGENW